MPNKKQPKAGKFYILLAACALVIGVTGYVFLSDAAKEQTAAPQLSVQVKPQEETEQSRTEETPEEQAPTKETVATFRTQTVMPVAGDVLQPYAMEQLAYNETTRDWRVHCGVDLIAREGQDVRAARDGTVLSVYDDDYLGTTVVVQHSGGYTSSYCGLQPEPCVKAGQDVAAGTIIGKVGNTALLETAREPHLHFEVTCNGEPTDPANFLYN